MKLLADFARRAFSFCRTKFWQKGHIFIIAPLMALQGNYSLENSNIISYDAETSTHDFNRLRLEGTLHHLDYEPLGAKVIIDNLTNYQFSSSNLTNDIKIYRAYLEYIGERHFIAIGRQQAHFGVGRIWNPVDIFNPIDSLSIETDERDGTESLLYQYAINDLSNFDIILSKDKNVMRLKGFWEFADLALLAGTDQDKERDLLGYEVAGELFETNIEFRSEGGFFYDKNRGEWQRDYIIGAEYGFQNSLSILGEYRYDGAIETDYFGTILSYQATPLLILSMLNITQLRDMSFFVAPSIDYSLADDMNIIGGAFFFSGSSTEEFGVFPDSYYFNLYIHF